MDFSSPPRPRVRGKPFKLFTDDLPKIDFNRTHLRDYSNGPSIGKRLPHTHVNRQNGLIQDRFSLPSLEPPDWDSLSTPDPSRSPSHVSVFNPNIAQLNNKIRRRHTVRENRDRVVLDQRFRRANDDLSVKSLPQTMDAKDGKSEEAVKEAFVRVSSTRSFRSKGSKAGDAEQKKEPEKPKSILQQLLDASARDSARRKRVEEGFMLYRQDAVKRRTAVSTPGDVRLRKETNDNTKSFKARDSDSASATTDKESLTPSSSEAKLIDPKCSDDIKENLDDVIPVSVVKHRTKEVKAKPGILKYNMGLLNTKIKHEHNLKPRLIHQDNITDLSSGDVKITVHAEDPANRLNALIFARVDSKKPRTKRRVNFDRLEENATSGPGKDKESRQNADKTVFDDEYRINGSLGNENNVSSDPFSNIRKRDAIRRKSRNRPTETKPLHTSSFPSYNRVARQGESPSSDNSQQFEKITENLKDPRADPFWKEVKEARADSRSEVYETLNRGVETGGVNDDVSSFRIPSKFSRKSGRRGKIRINRNAPHIPNRFTPSDTVSTPTSGSIFGNSDIDTLSDMQSFFDEIDVEGFPDEIDRSLIGEDLIKAYRLWDRKRKAFPGGLRKIEAPSEQSEEFILSKTLGAVRTYKLSNQAQGMKGSSTENKEPLTSVEIGTF